LDCSPIVVRDENAPRTRSLWRVARAIALRKIIARLWLTLRHQIFGLRYRRLTIEYIDDTALIVLPEVFNPVLFRTGECLAWPFSLRLSGMEMSRLFWI
jgi:hypothetical protein